MPEVRIPVLSCSSRLLPSNVARTERHSEAAINFSVKEKDEARPVELSFNGIRFECLHSARFAGGALRPAPALRSILHLCTGLQYRTILPIAESRK